MYPDSKRLLSSIPASPGLFASVLRLLSAVDDFPPDATGVLRFGGHGMILLESRKICWAVAASMRGRLTDILCNQGSSRLPKALVEDVFRKCKLSGQPLGETLVKSGLVSEFGLRAALLKHTGEAIAQLARTGVGPDHFTAHNATSYDPRFAFSACEILAMLGAVGDPARATAAHHELESTLVQESTGAAFARSSAVSGALVIAVERGCDFAVQDLVEVCNWISGLFDVVRTFEPEACAARAVWGGRAGLVTWRLNDVGYVGLCSSRAAATRLVSKLGQRASGGGFVSGAVAQGDGSA
ncbi:MAG TPA: hypothetical protein VNG33_06875 [Polyangiaceae bacterium]|nr:hypothetical protein [Polyangiaceae bacterium]